MGKKARTKSGKIRAQVRKVDKSTLPDPPAPLEGEIGSAKLLTDAKGPTAVYKVLDQDGYDDGGVADLTLVIDLDDSVLRRKRGEIAYFTALRANLLPRITTGSLAVHPRREQKIRLARLLFSPDNEQEDDSDPSEVYVETVEENDDEVTKQQRKDRLMSAKYSLRLSNVLVEPACSSLCLSEISKRYLSCYGKEKAEDALRCAEKAIEIASDGFYDSDDIAIEAEDEPKIDPKFEKNATSEGLAHPNSLKYQAVRVSQLCLRSAYLHRGNALSALGRNEEARKSYEMVFPMLQNEPRSARVDWERMSLQVNIGNTYSREGNFEKANEYYDIGEALGKAHVDYEFGNSIEGMGIMVAAMRSRAFALKKVGREDEAKKQMRGVLDLQLKLNAAREEKKVADKKAAEEEAAKNLAASQAQQQQAPGQLVAEA